MVKVSCSVCGKSRPDDGGNLFTCSRCNSVPYCSRACQKSDWKAGHKVRCEFLNTGDAQQIAHDDHEKLIKAKERARDFVLNQSTGPREFRLLWELFEKSEGETNYEATLKKQKQIFLRVPKKHKNEFVFLSLPALSNAPTSMLELPTSPLLIALGTRGVDPDYAVHGPEGKGETPLHLLANFSDPKDEYVNRNQILLGKQLLAAGANVNARSDKATHRLTPLHKAVHSAQAINLDFIKLLLDHGADVNAKNSLGETPIFHTLRCAAGAAKFLLTYSDQTDPNVVVTVPESPLFGHSFLAEVRRSIHTTRIEIILDSRPDTSQFLLEQLLELEALLVERGAVHVGPTYE